MVGRRGAWAAAAAAQREKAAAEAEREAELRHALHLAALREWQLVVAIPSTIIVRGDSSAVRRHKHRSR